VHPRRVGLAVTRLPTPAERAGDNVGRCQLLGCRFSTCHWRQTNRRPSGGGSTSCPCGGVTALSCHAGDGGRHLLLVAERHLAGGGDAPDEGRAGVARRGVRRRVTSIRHAGVLVASRRERALGGEGVRDRMGDRGAVRAAPPNWPNGRSFEPPKYESETVVRLASRWVQGRSSSRVALTHSPSRLSELQEACLLASRGKCGPKRGSYLPARTPSPGQLLTTPRPHPPSSECSQRPGSAPSPEIPGSGSTLRRHHRSIREHQSAQLVRIQLQRLVLCHERSPSEGSKSRHRARGETTSSVSGTVGRARAERWPSYAERVFGPSPSDGSVAVSL
jgi:hypothetical protein